MKSIQGQLLSQERKDSEFFTIYLYQKSSGLEELLLDGVVTSQSWLLFFHCAHMTVYPDVNFFCYGGVIYWAYHA